MKSAIAWLATFLIIHTNFTPPDLNIGFFHSLTVIATKINFPLISGYNQWYIPWCWEAVPRCHYQLPLLQRAWSEYRHTPSAKS